MIRREDFEIRKRISEELDGKIRRPGENDTALALRIGINQCQVFDMKNQRHSPGVYILWLLTLAGADPYYILTGRRSDAK